MFLLKSLCNRADVQKMCRSFVPNLQIGYEKVEERDNRRFSRNSFSNQRVICRAKGFIKSVVMLRKILKKSLTARDLLKRSSTNDNNGRATACRPEKDASKSAICIPMHAQTPLFR